jgi:Rrf2 family iron-sulfur cluster assembly transcriptional regulator
MFSSLTRNAVNTLLWVCKKQDYGPVTADSLSKRLGLSISYLESLLSKLKKLGFLVSYRGPGGGYCSNGEPDSLRLIDLIRKLDFHPPHKTQIGNADLCSIDKDLLNGLMQDFLFHDLGSMSFVDIINMMDEEVWGVETVKEIKTAEGLKFRSLQIHKLPLGPNSVFNLAASMSI